MKSETSMPGDDRQKVMNEEDEEDETRVSGHDVTD